MKKNIVFVWDNFGPIHADRADAVGKYFSGEREVIGIELSAKSDTYEWVSETRSSFKKITLQKVSGSGWLSKILRLISLLRQLLANIKADFFFCHYERPGIFISAIILRMLGRRVFIMNDSKFDDYQRVLWREIVKYIFYIPYNGGLASGVRSRDYLNFLGVKSNGILTNYNSMSLARIVSYVPQDHLSKSFDSRYFVIIARFVEKKNLFNTISAYKIYVDSVENPRKLHIVGSGPLEEQLKTHVLQNELSELVIFHGFLQTKETIEVLADSLALLLLSTEEQFGNVVIEATALGIPCIVSTACGARDMLVHTGVNGFVVEPNNIRGAAYFMGLISSSFVLWQSMSKASLENSKFCDVPQFVKAIEYLVK